MLGLQLRQYIDEDGTLYADMVGMGDSSSRSRSLSPAPGAARIAVPVSAAPVPIQHPLPSHPGQFEHAVAAYQPTAPPCPQQQQQQYVTCSASTSHIDREAATKAEQIGVIVSSQSIHTIPHKIVNKSHWCSTVGIKIIKITPWCAFYCKQQGMDKGPSLLSAEFPSGSLDPSQL
jgi:hypothetical protein